MSQTSQVPCLDREKEENAFFVYPVPFLLTFLEMSQTTNQQKYLSQMSHVPTSKMFHILPSMRDMIRIVMTTNERRMKSAYLR
jgi:hypothetical protein